MKCSTYNPSLVRVWKQGGGRCNERSDRERNSDGCGELHDEEYIWMLNRKEEKKLPGSEIRIEVLASSSEEDGLKRKGEDKKRLEIRKFVCEYRTTEKKRMRVNRDHIFSSRTQRSTELFREYAKLSIRSHHPPRF